MLGQKLLSNVRTCFGLMPSRCMYSTSRKFPVSIIGAMGSIGLPLSLLLRNHPLVSQLTLYDIEGTVGTAADLSHIDVFGRNEGITWADDIREAIKSSKIIVAPAGKANLPSNEPEKVFELNAFIISQIADAMALVNPTAFFVIMTHPINSTVPIVAEVLKKHGVYDPSRVFGLTTLNSVRARKFIGEHMQIDPKRVLVPVIGGNSAETIVPLMSHMAPEFKGGHNDIAQLTKRIKNAENEIVEAKNGKAGSSLSMAYACAKFVNSLLRALGGKRGVYETAYVKSCVGGSEFFASTFNLGKDGIVSFPPVPSFSAFEEKLIAEAMPYLEADIKRGIETGQEYQLAKVDQVA